MADGRFDEMLLGMAQKHRGIEDLLYTIMSFYERRTDLFHIKDNDKDKESGDGGSSKGFAPGKAEEMLCKQFRVFQARYFERAQPYLIASKEMVEQAIGAKPRDGPYGGASSSSAAAASASLPAPRPPPKQAIPDGVGASPLEGGDPGQWAKVQNAGSGYTWNQSDQDITIEINVEKCVASDIKVTFAPRKLSVKRKGEVILEGNLCEKISLDDCTWHLDSGKQVVLTLEKIKPSFWSGLFEGSS
mmetsp:Transcript_52731/g.133902  ORF Transcript_52731/g.133902 Transcript_52731/m.133902 type:complete len:245 (-) Transcript_52731:193-927(-)